MVEEYRHILVVVFVDGDDIGVVLELEVGVVEEGMFGEVPAPQQQAQGQEQPQVDVASHSLL